jgi:TRAP-type C4-dicarboxylate transport system permease small subunit
MRRWRRWLSAVCGYSLLVLIGLFVLLFGWRLLHPHTDAGEGTVWLGRFLGELVPLAVVIAGIFGFVWFLNWLDHNKEKRNRRLQEWEIRSWQDETKFSLKLMVSLLAVAAVAWTLSAAILQLFENGK